MLEEVYVSAKPISFLFKYYKETRWTNADWPHRYKNVLIDGKGHRANIITLTEYYINPAYYR